MNKDIKDFFISYNKVDKEYAKWIAGTLEENDYTTYIQAWDFRPGNNFILQMQEAIKRCKRTIIVLSQNYLNSEYCQAEWAAAYNYDPTGKYRKLIPVRVSDVCPDGLLSGIIYIDLYGCDEEAAKKKLLNGIDENDNPRRKPNFPLSVVLESKNKDNIELYFEINKENLPMEISNRTRNNILKWYYDKEKYGFCINISDMNLNEFHNELEKYNKKIENGEEISDEEIYKYNNLKDDIERRKKFIEMKKYAIEFFLKDERIQNRLNIQTPVHLLEFIKKILIYDYFKQAQLVFDDNYMTIEVTLSVKTKEFHNYFRVYIEKEKLEKYFGDVIYEYFLLNGANADDLDSDLFEIVVKGFFHFLGEKIAYYNLVNIKSCKEVLNLFNYKLLADFY